MAKRPLSPEMRGAITARLEYYREMGIYDFYRRPVPEGAAEETVAEAAVPEVAEVPQVEGLVPQIPEEPVSQVPGSPTRDVFARAGVEVRAEGEANLGTIAGVNEIEEPLMAARSAPPEKQTSAVDHAAALQAIREDLGECTRCPLHQQGRKQIVFGVGNPYAELMFIGEAPGADEDIQGEPFVGRAGQLLNNMITAMGLKREEVYIANVIKCRPPGNRTPQPDECAVCSPFLLRQIEVIQPKALVALGAVAAKTLLAVNQPMNTLRGKWYEFHGVPLAVTFHPAYLLRNPPAKKDAWQDLQLVMKRLGLKAPKK